MTDKQKSFLSWGVTIFAAVCGVIAFFTVFADAVKTPFSFDEGYTGLQVAMGYKLNNYPVFEASVGIVLGYLFPLVGACVAIMGKGNKILAGIAAALMLTGGILVLCTLKLIRSINFVSISLGAGAIVSGIFAILGAITAAGSIFLDKYLDRSLGKIEITKSV